MEGTDNSIEKVDNILMLFVGGAIAGNAKSRRASSVFGKLGRSYDKFYIYRRKEKNRPHDPKSPNWGHLD